MSTRKQRVQATQVQMNSGTSKWKRVKWQVAHQTWNAGNVHTPRALEQRRKQITERVCRRATKRDIRKARADLDDGKENPKYFLQRLALERNQQLGRDVIHACKAKTIIWDILRYQN